MEQIIEWSQWLNDAAGIDLSIIHDSYDRGRMIQGFANTIYLSLICLALSLVIGLVGAWLQRSPLVWTRRIVQGYIQLFRNTPPLVQMYFFFFALGSLMPRVENDYAIMEPILSNWHWAILSLSFFAGSFNVEIFRSGIEAVPRSTIEAADSLGFNRLQIYLYVVLPLAFRVCLPALNNNLVNLVKTTTLAYAIAVPEMLYVANQIWSDNLNVPEIMTFLLFAYVFLVGLLVWAMNSWERAMRLPGFGT